MILDADDIATGRTIRWLESELDSLWRTAESWQRQHSSGECLETSVENANLQEEEHETNEGLKNPQEEKQEASSPNRDHRGQIISGNCPIKWKRGTLGCLGTEAQEHWMV